MSDVDVRAMRWWDIPDVHALERSLFPVDPWSVEQFWQELAASSRDYLVVARGPVIVGYGGTSTIGSDADLQTIAVAPTAQGTGVASALLAALLERAGDRGARRILLEVRGDNVAAQHLYERFGFEPIARRARYYPDGEDALVMQARIGRGSERE